MGSLVAPASEFSARAMQRLHRASRLTFSPTAASQMYPAPSSVFSG